MKSNITVTFFSNYLLHHQTPFCEAMIKRIGANFRFVATEPTPEFRLKIGYHDFSDVSYVVYSYKNDDEHKKALKLATESDVVIIGSAPDYFIEERVRQNKLTFRYSERFFKEGKIRLLDPRVFMYHYKQDFKYRSKNLYMLCASAYTAPDCRFILSYPEKTYKWGYFPETALLPYDQIAKQKQSGDKVKILWASRFIKYKHPEDAINLAIKLKAAGLDFQIEMLGIGELRQKCEDTVREKGLNDVISFTGPFSPKEVLERMRSADIFLFTSDKGEGWGAVLNESMSNACAVVANREIGSVPYLIENGKNGLIYDRKDKNSLYQCVKKLVENEPLRKTLGKNAYDTIKTVWNAETAADRLITLIDCINNGTPVPFTSGPCSKD
ncbi:MAG: glycosyltransferase [Clostridia bacterium]|nr:glycosyltransferase [Clostridia bacterium]